MISYFVMNKLFLIIFFTLLSNFLYAQQAQPADIEELKKEILELNTQVDHIQFNLGQSQNKFKRGIAVATIGYSVTIAGGLMLGRKNDSLGKVLLIAGGAMGVTGTFLLVDSFKYLGRASKKARTGEKGKYK